MKRLRRYGLLFQSTTFDNISLIFHTLFILFTIVGWRFVKTRRIHLITVLLTIFSWVVLGYWHGFGYCFWTDWHWNVRSLLGKPPLHNSYIQFLIIELTGLYPPYLLTQRVTTIVFVLIIVMTLTLNVRDYLRYSSLRRRH
ncbi:DUF2784 domain-containing protein [Salinispira pacifica]|uniref:DUF2784 domain-containing protein n=1 Tax=Salinispira pacifica TaxID=1307761 RepID=UPI001183F4C9|nr:DUF2784 domain-containing protein [Salinispira pacifica]